MVQETTKALDNGQSQAKATLAFTIRIRAPIELAENVFPLLFGNSEPAIPDFDAQRRVSETAANNDAAVGGVADRIGDEVQQNPFQQDEVAAYRCPAWHDPQGQALLMRRPRKRRLYSVQELAGRKLGEVRAQHVGIELGNVEERIEELIHGSNRGIDPLEQSMTIRRVQTALQLCNEQAQRVQRLPQIVAGGRQRTRFSQVGKFQLTGSFPDPAFERRV